VPVNTILPSRPSGPLCRVKKGLQLSGADVEVGGMVQAAAAFAHLPKKVDYRSDNIKQVVVHGKIVGATITAVAGRRYARHS